MFGKIQSFDENKIYDVVTTYVEADEVERALWILNNLPGIYRDQMPLKLAKLRSEILKAMVTPHAYMSCDLDATVNKEENLKNFEILIRTKLVEGEAKRMQESGASLLNVVDVGPGEYMIPMGLKEKGVSFKYHPVFMDKKAYQAALPDIESVLDANYCTEPDTTIFLALEIIEHLPAPVDLATECLRHCGGWPARIHLSTPMYTYDGSAKHWRKPCGLPHLRTYTPGEFLMEAQRTFPGYQWQLYPGVIMSLRGMRNDMIDSVPIVDFQRLA